MTAELTLRQKQYSYYRDQLLTFAEDNPLSDSNESLNVRWTTLGEVATLLRGNGLAKADFVEAGKPVIHYGQIYTYYGNFTDKVISHVQSSLFEKLVKAQKGDVIITNTSENLEDVGTAVGWLGNEEIATGGHATVVKPNSELLGKYFVYYTQTTDFAKQKRKFVKGTKVIDVSAKDLEQFNIPVPPLKLQNKIVEILDKFQAMTEEVSGLLPEEIALREKQYVYYREQLLTFNTNNVKPASQPAIN